jgi:hypothetical protein
MNTEEQVDRTLEGWLATGPTELPDRSVAAIVNQLDNTKQRGLFWLPGRLNMPRFLPALGGAAVLVLVAVLAITFYANQQRIGAQPSPTVSPAPTVAAPPSPAPTTPPQASPRPSPASTASRFTSTIHGISIDYPTGWQIRPASEAWGLDPVGFDATDIDIIFDPILEGDLYIGMASGLASEPLAGPPHDDWPSLQEASQLCSGGGGAGRYPVDNATSWAGYCVDADGSTNWYAFVGTATRGYFIYLHAGNEGLSATYGGERFDALLQTVDLLP